MPKYLRIGSLGRMRIEFDSTRYSDAGDNLVRQRERWLHLHRARRQDGCRLDEEGHDETMGGGGQCVRVSIRVSRLSDSFVFTLSALPHSFSCFVLWSSHTIPFLSPTSPCPNLSSASRCNDRDVFFHLHSALPLFLFSPFPFLQAEAPQIFVHFLLLPCILRRRPHHIV